MTENYTEMALSIDHIRVPIFEGLDRQTLFNCRLVSIGWAYFGSKALQKITDIQLVQPHPCYDTFPAVIPSPIYRHIFDPDLSLNALETLINNSSEFPSNSFCLTHMSRNEGDPRAHKFLEAHGKIIKKLEFGGVLYLKDVKQLLLSQAPNLEHLLLNYLAYVITESGNFCANSDSASATGIQESVCHQNSLYASIGLKPLFKNLKIFKSNSDLLPEMFIQQILEFSLKLNEISLHIKYFYCLLKPENRIHLLKKLEITITHDNIDAFEMIANEHEGHLALQEISVLGFGLGIIELYENVYIRAVDIVLKILRGSAFTCQKLRWRQTRKHFPEIPEMPRVKHLSFASWGLYCLCFPSHVFLTGEASLTDMFPNLRSLRIESIKCIKGMELMLATYFGDDDLVPVPSVKNVYFNYSCNIEPYLLKMFRQIFSNATIHTDLESEVDF